MEKSIIGIHHITAIASDPQRTIDFYTGTLGLDLVKLTVNFDDPSTYHFYFGDDLGRPGTLLTFFPWPGAPKGRRGIGQVTAFALSVPAGALDYWAKRLSDQGTTAEPARRFQEKLLRFEDPDGTPIELVESSSKQEHVPRRGPVPHEYAIRGDHSVTLSVEGYERSAQLLIETLGFRETQNEGSRFRFEIGTGGEGEMVDILCVPDIPPGATGTGTIHHVAWRTPSDPEQCAWQWKMAHVGLNVTPIVDRQYFHSIYFREPGGVLFEIATDPPGFTVDEAPSELGTHLCLPPQYEADRSKIEKFLPPLRLPVRTQDHSRI